MLFECYRKLCHLHQLKYLMDIIYSDTAAIGMLQKSIMPPISTETLGYNGYNI